MLRRLRPLALSIALTPALLLTTGVAAQGAVPDDGSAAALVPQGLDYTENPVDVPNPDRGFYRANDGMVVPVSGTGSGTVNVGDSPVIVGGATVSTRVSHIYFDLRNFSDNAFTARGPRYTASYRAPVYVSIASRPGDSAPYAYDTHFDYWQANVLPTWPRGTSQPLTADALAYVRDKLEQVRAGNGVALVRFNYDGPGYSWVDVEHPEDGYMDRSVADIEPDKATLLGHIAQLAPILDEYEDVIMGVDGGWFGPWGEMHSTTFGTSPEAYAWLLDAWLEAVPESRSITVHAGAFLSWYNATYGTHYTFANIDQIPAPQPGTAEARFGFFNDSYAYGEDEGDNYPDDWGSLSEGARWPGEPLGAPESYDRGRLMTWIRHQNNLYGGEAQGDETPWNTYPFVAWEASYAQTVYLNADYESDVHDRWGEFTYTEANVTKKMTNAYEAPYRTEYAIFDPEYDGRTGAEYWRDRLGYRLVLRDANASEWVRQDGTLEFAGSIQNVGFGNIVNKKDVSIVLQSTADGASYTALTDLDARDWRPDLDSRASNTAAYRDLNFSVDMREFGDVPVGDYEIYLKINDPKETSANKRSIRFANNGENIWDVDLGANLIGSTTVDPAGAGPEATQTLQVQIPEAGPGEFLWSIDGTNGLVDLGTAVLSGDHYAASGAINPVRVTDTRLESPGWSVSAEVSDFRADEKVFDGKYLGWTPNVTENTGGAVAGAPVASGFVEGDGLSAPATLGSATDGHEKGSALLGADLDLQVPLAVGDGTYRAALVLTALS